MSKLSNIPDKQDKEIAYYKKQLNEMAMANVKLEMAIAGVHHEIRQKRLGFALLYKLQQTIGKHKHISDIFKTTISAINSTLGMEKTLILVPTEKPNIYKPGFWNGFNQEQSNRLPSLCFKFPKKFSSGTGLYLINKAANTNQYINKLKSILELPYFICLPIMLEKNPIGLLISGRMREIKPFYPPLDSGDVDTLQAITALISSSLQTRRIAVLEERVEAQIADLKLAAHIQKDLLPKTNPQLENYDIAGVNIPAKIVGGDYYDFIKLDSSRMAIVLGDVCGKGLPASLLMANTQATIRGQAFINQKTNQCLQRANSLLYKSTNKKTFVSSFFSILDKEKDTLKYSNAGQIPPLLFSLKKRPFALETRGLVLGVKEDTDYIEDEIKMKSGDILIIYSDGICEAMNDKNEEFGEQRLIDIITLNKEESANKLMEKILSAIEFFTRGASQHDDMTAVILRRN